MIGQIIGNYKIEEKLGEGGMGAVYKGVDTMLDREVAIKALRPELASQTSVVERFRTEAVTLAKLNHPNIATLYTMFRQGDELYMVLEFVRGETLDSIMKRRGAMPAEEAIPVFCQVLDGIDHAHELGIVHRDIKPANMMLTEKGTLKVLDFGIARLLGSARMTRAGNIIGTLEYMAPEQVRGQETDGRSDIYALGMMLYEVLTGQLPFQSENEFELMKMQTEQIPRSPREIDPSIPVEVENAIMTAIQKNPEDRFQTGGEFREALLDAGFAEQGTMHGITGSHRRPSTRPSRPPVSQSGLSYASTGAEAAPIKETRLGDSIPTPPSQASAQPVSAVNAMKATRLAQAPAPASGALPKATRLGGAAPDPTPKDGSGSFFSKLTAMHYAAAGLVLLILIGAAVAVPLVLLGGKQEATKTDAKPANSSEKPDIVTMPKEQPQQMDSRSAPPASTGIPSGGNELTPLAANTPAEKPASSGAKPTAPAPKPAAPAAKPKADKSRAEKLLTGN
ncbi:MAG: protein kinase [Acidobacteria bacterium]|nr:protein kinase [Acidobacteriota bacterium]